MEVEEVQEACYFLRELGMSFDEIAKKLELEVSRVRKNYKAYSRKISEIDKADFETSRQFWSDLVNEEEGNVKVTLVDQYGRFYHGRKADFEKMDDEKLVHLLVVNREFLDKNPMNPFLDSKVRPGYDPMAPLREIKKSARMIEELLLKRESKSSNEQAKLGAKQKKNFDRKV